MPASLCTAPAAPVAVAHSKSARPSGPSRTEPKGANRRQRRRRRSKSDPSADSLASPVADGTAPRECRGRAERRYQRTGWPSYPHYYVTHAALPAVSVEVTGVDPAGKPAVVTVRADTRRRAFAEARKRDVYPDRAVRQERREPIPLCDDCHAEQLLADRARLAREEGYAPDDGVVRPVGEVLADAPADPDRSASGGAIEAMGNALTHDEKGELAEVTVAEGGLLPDTEAALLTEIKAGILAGDGPDALADYRAQVGRYLKAAGAAKVVRIVV